MRPLTRFLMESCGKYVVSDFLTPYCSTMHPIEGKWYQFKAHELVV
jgi:hypothetical protein